jgi:hypothetical protein
MGLLFLLVRALFADKADLALENLALRQQLAVLHRKSPRPRLNALDRAFWTVLKGQLATWADALIIVKPETVVRWHREAFRLYTGPGCPVRDAILDLRPAACSICGEMRLPIEGGDQPHRVKEEVIPNQGVEMRRPRVIR